MTSPRKIWPYAEAQAHLDELLRLVVGGEEQFVTLPDGEVVSVWRVDETSRDAEGKPFVSGMATFRNAPQDEDFKPERLRGTLRDIDL